ncbi:MAG: DedA family protein, partial [Actinomycetota bacterium]|nr:DedA family protein [Actinomycetota bacterium]
VRSVTGLSFASVFTTVREWIEDLTDWLEDTSANWWFLLVIFLIALLDSVIPIVPSETAVILGGVAAGVGDQQLLLVIVCGAAGAFAGDNLAYEIGHRFSGPIARRAERREKTLQRLEWARRSIAERGGMLLITARFIPGGRTALTISSGLTSQPRLWFVKWIGIAAVIWACYAAILGYIFGQQFADNHTLAFILAFSAALSITILIEVVRHVRGRKSRSGSDDEASDRVGAAGRS